jgi:hypothetical protein
MTKIEHERCEAESKAWAALSKYKFWMFGYWAAIWVHLNRLCPERKKNPFSQLVKHARVYTTIDKGL